jgi:ankyrin repeat protein
VCARAVRSRGSIRPSRAGRDACPKGSSLVRQAEDAAGQAKARGDFAQLASWARHAKYREIEDAMNQEDWTLPIDYQDELGNTLLQVAAQNGSKRIAKLALRRGADINKQNLAGQTVLHYVFAYAFDDLAEYLQQKGADDALRNADGLTCYEGLTNEAVLAI